MSASLCETICANLASACGHVSPSPSSTVLLRFSHQDVPPTDGEEWHHRRSAPRTSRALIAACGSSRRGAAIKVADDPLQPGPAAPSVPCDWVRNPGEKTSVMTSSSNTAGKQDPPASDRP
jgi:hypothetical protein